MPRNRELDDYEDDDDEDESVEELPASARKLIRDLRKQIKEKSKEDQDVRKELDQLRAERRKSSVSEVLEGKGVDQRYARFVLAEVDDPTEEAVAKWLDDNAELVGYQSDAAKTAVPEGDQEAYRKFADADKGGKSGAPDPVLAQLSDPNLTADQLAALIGKPLS